jgi:solute carrier family 25 carnitine/acylcarnitine transporter 20/29
MSEGLKSFMAGWAGGLGILVVGHPFDTVKTVYQNAKPGTYKSSMDVVRAIVKEDGALGLYKGVTAPMAGIGTVFALYFLAYDSTERLIRSLRGMDSTTPISMFDVLICGGSTGVFGSLVLGPAELIKIRQQTAKQSGQEGAFGAVAKQLYREKALFRGLSATMLRDVPGSMAWFGAYEYTKKSICVDPKKPTVTQALVAGGMGGMGMWSFALPLDAVKTRVQANIGKDSISMAGAAKALYAEGGIGAFYRGIGPALLRAFPANAACFAAKESAQKLLDKAF